MILAFTIHFFKINQDGIQYRVSIFEVLAIPYISAALFVFRTAWSFLIWSTVTFRNMASVVRVSYIACRVVDIESMILLGYRCMQDPRLR
jgi:hypothetical protein